MFYIIIINKIIYLLLWLYILLRIYCILFDDCNEWMNEWRRRNDVDEEYEWLLELHCVLCVDEEYEWLKELHCVLCVDEEYSNTIPTTISTTTMLYTSTQCPTSIMRSMYLKYNMV